MRFRRGYGTSGVSYTDGGAAAPPTFSFATPILCSATPSFVRFSGFLALKGWCFAFAMQNCQIYRYFVISVYFVIPRIPEHAANEPFCPSNFFPKSSTYWLWDSLECFGCSRRVPARGPPPSSRRALVRRAGSDPSRGDLKPDKRIDISLGPALAWGLG